MQCFFSALNVYPKRNMDPQFYAGWTATFTAYLWLSWLDASIWNLALAAYEPDPTLASFQDAQAQTSKLPWFLSGCATESFPTQGSFCHCHSCRLRRTTDRPSQDWRRNHFSKHAESIIKICNRKQKLNLFSKFLLHFGSFFSCRKP